MKNLIHFGALALALSAPSFAKADDATSTALFEKAKKAYADRTNPASVKEAVALLKDAEAQAVSAELKYDVLILASRSLYWQGQHTADKEEKKALHLEGRAKADAAGKLRRENEERTLGEEYSEAPYFAGINLARWAEANGIVSSIQHKGELIEYMNQAKDAARTTRDGADGETIDGYGPARVLGRMFHKLPGILGGSHTESVKWLRAAVKGADNYVLNVLYLVDTLASGNGAEKAESTATLDKLLKADPNTFNVERLPETLEEFKLAQDYKAGKPLP